MFKQSVSKNKTNKKVIVGSPYKNKAVIGPQGQQLIPTVMQRLCGSTGLSACTVFMPPGRISKPHLHEKAELIVVVVEGFAVTLVGPELKPVFHGPGEFLFVPEGVPHAAVNLNPSQRLIAFEMRTDPHFNEDVVPLPDYDDKVALVAKDLQDQFANKTLAIPAHWDVTDTRPFTFAADKAQL